MKGRNAVMIFISWRRFLISWNFFTYPCNNPQKNVRIDRESFLTVWKEAIKIERKIPIMTYSQYRRARKLVHQCCNYESGNCLALDDGEEWVCVQSISYSLLCRWFRAAVLSLDESSETALLHQKEQKRCTVGGQPFLPGSNRVK